MTEQTEPKVFETDQFFIDEDGYGEPCIWYGKGPDDFSGSARLVVRKHALDRESNELWPLVVAALASAATQTAEQAQPAEKIIRLAISDPRHFLPREPDELVTHWAARAVIKALAAGSPVASEPTREDWQDAVDRARARGAAGSPVTETTTQDNGDEFACCMGPFADGTHAKYCRQRCQDCKGDPDGPFRCRCRDLSGVTSETEKR